MSISTSQKPPYNDKERFEKLLILLPEDRISEFFNELEDARYDDHYNIMIDNYKKNIESSFLIFQNKKIQGKLESFKKVFKSLQSFIFTHFWRVTPESSLIALYPEIGKSELPEDKRQWRQFLNELGKLIDDSRNKYLDFLVTSRGEVALLDDSQKDFSGKKKRLAIKGKVIKIIEILEDKTKLKKITVFINEKYDEGIDFNRRRYWGLLYELAERGQIENNKGFFDYFNSQPLNPLYSTYGYKKTQILKKDGDYIVANIKLKIITQKKASQRATNA